MEGYSWLISVNSYFLTGAGLALNPSSSWPPWLPPHLIPHLLLRARVTQDSWQSSWREADICLFVRRNVSLFFWRDIQVGPTSTFSDHLSCHLELFPPLWFDNDWRLFSRSSCFGGKHFLMWTVYCPGVNQRFEISHAQECESPQTKKEESGPDLVLSFLLAGGTAVSLWTSSGSL